MRAFLPDGTNFGKPFEPDEFIWFYSKIYRFVSKDAQLEERISKIRLQPNLRYSDIRAIFEWKVGSKSEDHRTVAIPRSNTVIDLNAAAKIACGNKRAIQPSEVQPTIEQYVNLPGVGLVYAITLLHFASSGRYPIYDKFAHLGLLAHHSAIPVGTIISDRCYHKFWRSTKDWMDDYRAYCYMLDHCFGLRQCQNDERIDQALWTYGHLFNENSRNLARSANPTIIDPEILENYLPDPEELRKSARGYLA